MKTISGKRCQQFILKWFSALNRKLGAVCYLIIAWTTNITTLFRNDFFLFNRDTGEIIFIYRLIDEWCVRSTFRWLRGIQRLIHLPVSPQLLLWGAFLISWVCLSEWWWSEYSQKPNLQTELPWLPSQSLRVMLDTWFLSHLVTAWLAVISTFGITYRNLWE